MRRKILFVFMSLIMLCLSITLFASGQKTTTGEETKVADVTFWTFIGIHQKFYESMAEKFNQENPGMKLQVFFGRMGKAGFYCLLSGRLYSGSCSFLQYICAD